MSPRIIYKQGWLDERQFDIECSDIGTDPKRTVLIFPGNPGHHTKNTTLFSIKYGAGLAALATTLGNTGHPVLSLPTTGMESWYQDTQTQQIAQTAIADLYRALGAGFSLLLPVRPHINNAYFSQALLNCPGCEPNFWGGIQNTPNQALSDYYLTELAKLHQFIYLSDEKKRQTIAAEPSNFRYQAFLDGEKKQTTHDQWLTPNRQTPLIKPRPLTQAKNKPLSDSRLLLPVNKQKLSIEQSHIDLLKAYVCGSAWRRFFCGHWNTHHATEVQKILDQINKQYIQSTQELLTELRKITLVNPKGSLSKRIQIIERYVSNQQATQQQPNNDTAPSQINSDRLATKSGPS